MSDPSADDLLLERVDAMLLGYDRRVADLARRVVALEAGRDGTSLALSPRGEDPSRGHGPLSWEGAAAMLDATRGAVAAVVASLREEAAWLAAAPPVVDLGSGRGELLRCLVEVGAEARGVEGNPVLAGRLRAENLPVAVEDLFVHLEGCDDGTAGAVAAVRLVEHLAPAEVADLLLASHRVLRPGGRLLVEAAQLDPAAPARFWGDPSRVRPYPPAALRLLVEDAGFAVEGEASGDGPGGPWLRLRAVRR